MNSNPSRELSIPSQPSLDQIQALTSNPLSMLPVDWRVMAWQFWTFYARLLPQQLELASRLARWSQDGLTREDARRIFLRLTAAERAAEIRFPGDLLAELAGEAAEAIRLRNRDRATMQRREEATAARAGYGVVREMLAGVCKGA